MKPILHGEKRKTALAAAAILFAAILFYEVLEHFAPVRQAVSLLLKVAAPIVYGLCLAYVLNLPMSLLENRVFFRLKAKKPGLARVFSIFTSYLLFLAVIALVFYLVIPKVVSGVFALLGSLGG